MLKYEIYWHLKAFASSHVKCCLNQGKAYTYSGLQAGTVFGCLHLAVLDINRPCTYMGYISGWKVLSLYFLYLSQPNCSLHLSQKFGQYYPYTRYSPMKSWTAAPGIIMATGTLKCSFFVFLYLALCEYSSIPLFSLSPPLLSLTTCCICKF